jgi:hypothetical protein
MSFRSLVYCLSRPDRRAACSRTEVCRCAGNRGGTMVHAKQRTACLKRQPGRTKPPDPTPRSPAGPAGSRPPSGAR